jgi:lysophospholipase L1-like esterase
MPLGDSITYGDGSTSHGGYREPLFHLVLSHTQSVTFVGLMSDGPDTVDGVPFPKHHEGHSGYTISGVIGFAAQAIQGYAPQMVLLMLGTNDIAFSEDPPNAPTRLGELMDIILDEDPNLLLVVAQIVPTMDDDKNVAVEALNAAIPDLVQTRLEAGKHVAMVDMYGAFVENPNYKTEYMFNTYHPSDAGYVKMAETWYDRIGSLLR